MKIIVVISQSGEYRRLADNLIRSAARVGIAQEISIHEPMFPEGIYGGNRFREAVRLGIALEHLKRGESVLLCDADVVFLKNPMDLIGHELRNHELVGQCVPALPNPKVDAERFLCPGFLAVRPTPLTLELFDASEPVDNPFIHSTDQEYLNAKLQLVKKYGKLKINYLTEECFPCGDAWRRNHLTSNPFIVHYNYWVGGKWKLEKMKEFGHLFPKVESGALKLKEESSNG